MLFAEGDHGKNVDVDLDSPGPHIGHYHFKDGGVHSAVTQCDQQNIIILKCFNFHILKLFSLS